MELQAFLAQWMSFSEAAITAAEHQDDDRVIAALAGRESLMEQIETAMRRYLNERGGSRRAPGARSADVVPVEQIVADIQASEARLQASLESFRARVQTELEQIGQGETAISRYLRTDEPKRSNINIMR